VLPVLLPSSQIALGNCPTLYALGTRSDRIEMMQRALWPLYYHLLIASTLSTWQIAHNFTQIRQPTMPDTTTHTGYKNFDFGQWQTHSNRNNANASKQASQRTSTWFVGSVNKLKHNEKQIINSFAHDGLEKRVGPAADKSNHPDRWLGSAEL
jgi:hypothetical protein